EFGGIELSLRRAEQRIESSAAADRAECRAVPGCDVIEPVGEHEATGARHVLRHDRGIARNEACHMAGESARIDVISAASAVADVKIDRFALVKVRRTLRVTERDRTEREDRGGAHQYQNTHAILPLPRWRITHRPASVRCSKFASPCGTRYMRTSASKDTSKLLSPARSWIASPLHIRRNFNSIARTRFCLRTSARARPRRGDARSHSLGGGLLIGQSSVCYRKREGASG